MNKRKWTAASVAMLIAVLLASFAGCGGGSQEQSDDAVLFFVSEDYVLEGVGEPYVEERFAIDHSQEQRYEIVLEALRQPPEHATTALRDDLHINSVQSSLFGRTLTVDFSPDNLNGSSMEEDLLIGQIVRTLLVSFPGARSVEITINGQTAETLMGHVSLDDAFSLSTETDEEGMDHHDIIRVPCTGFT